MREPPKYGPRIIVGQPEEGNPPLVVTGDGPRIIVGQPEEGNPPLVVTGAFIGVPRTCVAPTFAPVEITIPLQRPFRAERFVCEPTELQLLNIYAGTRSVNASLHPISLYRGLDWTFPRDRWLTEGAGACFVLCVQNNRASNHTLSGAALWGTSIV